MNSSARVVGLAVVLVVGVVLAGAVGPAPAAGRPGSNVVNIDSMAFASHLDGGFVPIGTGDPLVHTLTGHVGRVIAVAFNHAGTQIVSGGEDGTVRVWDTQTGASFAELSGHTGAVNCVAFSPNDTRVASGSDDKTIRLWDPAAGTTIQTYTEHNDAVLSVDIGVNGTRLLSGSADNTLKLWSSAATASLRTATTLAPSEDVSSMNASADFAPGAAFTQGSLTTNTASAVGA